jgi:hypothetical protein
MGYESGGGDAAAMIAFAAVFVVPAVAWVAWVFILRYRRKV